MAEAASTPTILFVHHPPIPDNSEWLDRIGLQDAGNLQRVLERHSQIQLICAGHVHQDFSGQFGTIPVLTTPSTGVQFRPGTTSLEVDQMATGYRVLELSDNGEWKTTVKRVAPPN